VGQSADPDELGSEFSHLEDDAPLCDWSFIEILGQYNIVQEATSFYFNPAFGWEVGGWQNTLVSK